jgi:hypothetical protein
MNHPNLHTPMNNCEHLRTKSILTPEGPHYAKSICEDCGRFVRWEPKPETIERHIRNAELISALKQKPLSDWEKEFLLSLEKWGPHLTPNQQNRLNIIAKEKGVTL